MVAAVFRIAVWTYARLVQVRETNLKQLVQGEKQFRVPLWQRQYTCGLLTTGCCGGTSWSSTRAFLIIATSASQVISSVASSCLLSRPRRAAWPRIWSWMASSG